MSWDSFRIHIYGLTVRGMHHHYHHHYHRIPEIDLYIGLRSGNIVLTDMSFISSRNVPNLRL